MDKNKILKKFENYVIRELGLARRTMLGYRYKLQFYLDWLIDNNIQPKKMDLNLTYDFLAKRRELGDSDRTIQGYKTAVQHFNHCIGMKSNPMLMVHLNKQHRKSPTNLLSDEELASIYRDCYANTLVQKRDRCMLGLIVFLGLQRKELEVLELEHLDLEEMKIYVPETPNANERTLYLHRNQINHLMNYVYDIRPRLVKEVGKDSDMLFFSYGDSNNLNGAVNRMLPRIKKQFHYIKDFMHLKQSRVAIWVNENGLREAQYLGGYRYVTSVQRYDFKSLDDLKSKLEHCHPMSFFMN